MNYRQTTVSSASIQTIKGILFDKDGTLFDFHRTWLPVVTAVADFASGGDKDLARKLLSAGGLDLHSGCFLPDSLVASGHADELAGFWFELGAVKSRQILREHMDDAFSRLGLANAVPVTDLERHFTFHKNNGLALGIATNDSENAVRATVKQFGLSRLVCFMAGYDSGFGPKPGPGMVLAFCEASGLSPRQVAVVGDSNHDMIMGRLAGAGLKIGVLTGSGTKHSLSETADFIIRDISCLEEIFSN
jgi:phosphoglycolate phosphatase